MKIESAKFVKGIVGTDESLADGTPQIAIIGRSNVGKSSVINSVTGKKGLARTSSFPGRTQEINLFLINNSLYLADLPGYGFAKGSWEDRERLRKLVRWYLSSDYRQKKILLVIDAYVGPTKDDLEILEYLEEQKKNVVIVANKVDKIKKSEYEKQLGKIRAAVQGRTVIPYSAEKKIGVKELAREILD